MEYRTTFVVSICGDIETIEQTTDSLGSTFAEEIAKQIFNRIEKKSLKNLFLLSLPVLSHRAIGIQENFSEYSVVSTENDLAVKDVGEMLLYSISYSLLRKLTRVSPKSY